MPTGNALLEAFIQSGASLFPGQITGRAIGGALEQGIAGFQDARDRTLAREDVRSVIGRRDVLNEQAIVETEKARKELELLGKPDAFKLLTRATAIHSAGNLKLAEPLYKQAYASLGLPAPDFSLLPKKGLLAGTLTQSLISISEQMRQLAKDPELKGTNPWESAQVLGFFAEAGIRKLQLDATAKNVPPEELGKYVNSFQDELKKLQAFNTSVKTKTGRLSLDGIAALMFQDVLTKHPKWTVEQRITSYIDFRQKIQTKTLPEPFNSLIRSYQKGGTTEDSPFEIKLFSFDMGEGNKVTIEPRRPAKPQLAEAAQELGGLEFLDSLETMLDKVEHLIGPFAGPTTNFRSQTLGGTGFSEDEAKFVALMDSLPEQMKAFAVEKRLTDLDLELLLRGGPRYRDNPVLFRAKLAQLRNKITRALERRERILGSSPGITEGLAAEKERRDKLSEKELKILEEELPGF